MGIKQKLKCALGFHDFLCKNTSYMPLKGYKWCIYCGFAIKYEEPNCIYNKKKEEMGI